MGSDSLIGIRFMWRCVVMTSTTPTFSSAGRSFRTAGLNFVLRKSVYSLFNGKKIHR